MPGIWGRYNSVNLSRKHFLFRTPQFVSEHYITAAFGYLSDLLEDIMLSGSSFLSSVIARLSFTEDEDDDDDDDEDDDADSGNKLRNCVL